MSRRLAAGYGRVVALINTQETHMGRKIRNTLIVTGTPVAIMLLIAAKAFAMTYD
jgi:hypothetical protein